MSELKQLLLNLCVNYVKSKIDNASQALKELQEASNEETKSSAGDKYETGRAMMQQDTERNLTQLAEAGKLMTALNQLNLDTKSTTAEPGSLVITSNGKFFLSISVGNLTLDGQTYFAVSPVSPIGLKLKGQKTGDEFSLNGKNYLIEAVL